MNKPMDLQLLEQHFSDLKQDSSKTQTLRAIQRVISRVYDLNFDIHIINNDTNEFFGMSIYPEQSVMDQLLVEIIHNKSKLSTLESIWSKNKNWILEIDSMLLGDMNLNANPSEMVAVLLHEIGHIVYSNSVPQRVNKVLRYEIMKLGVKSKQAVRWKKSLKIFNLIFIDACMSKNFHTKQEVEADKFVFKQGYGESLHNLIEKLLSAYGNRHLDKSETEMEKDVKTIVYWTLDTVTELEFRKKKLRQHLQTELLRNPSVLVREIAYKIKVDFFGARAGTTYEEAVQEQYIDMSYKNHVNEAFLGLFDKFGKLKKMSQSDIDYIEIEMSRIKNQDDKIYVLDMIYDNLDIINTGLDMLSKKQSEKVPVSKDTLKRYKENLEKLRKQVLAIPIKEPNYGVFIKYPKGYEG